ncbi:uncharacterized protein METZ01_LOCUS334518 [marine metagenome]|uniref:GatB/YqeY domain-containing protein n=1 Tax=marine metagenome TaxID=408172 RepID=A0A382Q7V2_9ZZZZ
MDLKESLLTAMKEALKAKNSLKLNTIRGLISEIKNREIDLRRDLEDDEIISIFSSEIKKRKEASTLFDKGGRSDLSEKENQEIAFLQEYLPEPISEEDLRKRLKEVILELGVSDIKDLGKVMKIIIPEFKGRADNGQIKNLVAEYLRQ